MYKYEVYFTSVLQFYATSYSYIFIPLLNPFVHKYCTFIINKLDNYIFIYLIHHIYSTSWFSFETFDQLIKYLLLCT